MAAAQKEDRCWTPRTSAACGRAPEVRRVLDALRVVGGFPTCLPSPRRVPAPDAYDPRIRGRICVESLKVDLLDDGLCGATNGGRPVDVLALCSAARVDVALGVVLGLALAAFAGRGLAAGARAACAGPVELGRRRARCTPPPRCGRHLRRGLEAGSVGAAPHLVRSPAPARSRSLTRSGCAPSTAWAVTTTAPATRSSALVGEVRDDRVRVEPWLRCEYSGGPLRSAIVAPLDGAGPPHRRARRLPRCPGRLRLEETRVVGEVAALVSAMVEPSEMEARGRAARARRAARAAGRDLAALRRQRAGGGRLVHPLAARGGARAADRVRRVHPLRVARQRADATVADELRYVEKYLRLEQARFGERLKVRVQVDPEALQAVLPVLSLQPLVENAVRHGVERQPEGGLVRSRASTSATTSRCGDPTTARGSTPSARATRSPAVARGSGSATCTGGCGRPSARATDSGRATRRAGTTVVMPLPSPAPGCEPR